MKILIISDAHGNVENIEKLSEQAKNADLVLFGGDFAKFNCPETGKPALEALVKNSDSIFAVLGNCDEPDFISEIEDADICVQKSMVFKDGLVIAGSGGRTKTDLDAREWAIKAVKLGVGEIVLNSIDADGMKNGYEINLTKMIAESVGVPVIASGGGGTPEHLANVLKEGKADAALIASMVHSMGYTVGGIKADLNKMGVPVRM